MRDEFRTMRALSPLDGRYGLHTEAVARLCSEEGLIRFRLQVEAAWLLFLLSEVETEKQNQLPQTGRVFLEDLALQRTTAQQMHEFCCAVKTIEKKINHDVKAVEYFIQETLRNHATGESVVALVHSCLTSEDANNLAYGLMLKEVREVLFFNDDSSGALLVNRMEQLAKDNADLAMISRTHGQKASPTTLGKEFAVFVARVKDSLRQISALPIKGKLNGAVGNYNSFQVVYPEFDWVALSCKFVNQLGLEFNKYTTQIESHDYMVRLFNEVGLLSSILLDLSKDCWSYISFDYFSLLKIEAEVGSSTMPHKINPIDFENAEGNLGLSLALSQHLARALPVSRLQRDLSDSTTLRNLGTLFGYLQVALKSLQKGLNKITPNCKLMQKDLDQSWQLLAEPIQMLLRKAGRADAYDLLKQSSRGQTLNQQQVSELIENLPEIDSTLKSQLQKITPTNYLGVAKRLAEEVRDYK